MTSDHLAGRGSLLYLVAWFMSCLPLLLLKSLLWVQNLSIINIHQLNIILTNDISFFKLLTCLPNQTPKKLGASKTNGSHWKKPSVVAVAAFQVSHIWTFSYKFLFFSRKPWRQGPTSRQVTWKAMRSWVWKYYMYSSQILKFHIDVIYTYIYTQTF